MIKLLQQNKGENDRGWPVYFRKRIGKNLQILTYHRVNDERDAYFPATTIRVFELQMRYLSKNFNILRLEDAVSMMTTRNLPENSVVITFDDGYRDNYENAFPILRKYGLTATIFLTAGAIGGNGVIWHDRVFSLFRSTRRNVLEDLSGSGQIYSLANLESRLKAMHATLRWLRGLSEDGREKGIASLGQALDVDGDCREMALMLQWEDVVHLNANGISFGAHTMTHPILSKLSEARAREEILESKKLIQMQIGAPVRTFAYPNGTESDFDHTSINILKEAGFECAVTTIFGTNYCGDDPFRLKRGSPWEESLAVFAAKMNWYKLTT
jgi:peptidoglycan/xylan/chitin deacetylase (PgdA/CDA1 family)